jgi:alanine racemase
MPSAGLSMTRLVVDLDALAHNHAVLAHAAPQAEIAPVVKSDGYGLGAVQVSRKLHACGARRFFVARLKEGEELRAGLGDRAATIYVLDGFAGQGARLAASSLTPVVGAMSDLKQAQAWDGPLVLHIDTGMNRQGLQPEEAALLAGRDVDLVMSHLGSADEPDNPRSAGQLARFQAVRALFPGAKASLSASAGMFLGADYQFDVVRPGVSLYGGGPREVPDHRLKAVATLTAPILDMRHLVAGEYLGYGSGARFDTDKRVAIVGAGYTDGIVRAGRNGGYAWFAGARRPLLAINMDILAIDLGEAEAHPGDEVELLGSNALVDDLAAAAGTVAHEVLVRLSRRAERIYLGDI